MSIEKSLPKTVVVNLDSGPHEVKKLPMGKYAELLQKLDNVPDLFEALSKLDTNDTANMLVSLRDMLVRSWGDLVGIVSCATGVPDDTLNNEVGLDEAVDLVMAAIEVNNFLSIKEKLVKVFSGKGKKDVLQAQAAAGYSKQSHGSGNGESQRSNS